MAAWAWFGIAGSVPVAIWCWQRRPRGAPTGGPRGPGTPWRVDLSRVRRARLGPWRTWIALSGLPAVELFNDEIEAAELAELRREVKARLKARP